MHTRASEFGLFYLPATMKGLRAHGEHRSDAGGLGGGRTVAILEKPLRGSDANGPPRSLEAAGSSLVGDDGRGTGPLG